MLLDKILPSKASEPPAAVQEPPAPSTDERTLIEIAQEYGRYSLPVGPVHAIRDGKCSCGKACDRPGNHPAAPCLQNQGSITYERHATKTVVGGFYGCTDQYGMMRLFSNDDLNIALELGVRTRLAALLVQGESAEKIFFDLVAVHGEIETIQCVSVDRRVLVLAHPPKHEFYGLPSRTLAEGLVFISDADRRAAGTDLLRGPKWVLLPPSINPDGSRWEWIQGSGPGEVKIATCPTWLLNAARNGLRTECDQ